MQCQLGIRHTDEIKFLNYVPRWEISFSCRYFKPSKSWYMIYFASASQIRFPVSEVCVMYVKRSPPVQSCRKIWLWTSWISLRARQGLHCPHKLFVFFGIVDLIDVRLRGKLEEWASGEEGLTCFNVIKILTSFMTCPTSWSLFVRIVLHATCRCFEGSKAKWTVAKDPVPRHCEVTI